ncbi:PREDICTED: uncharacterized protein LOC104718888 [Camelina sativa]|uniref:Uncharacterized protein LOC104718888 n=1 Tax=Camelina sativa TaxID=90675 RepID=A0ABM0U2W6_CAMSA|nr:PREDICTED: uncharacterized protein LOC104718888 [Camelina sativa]
MLKKMGMIGPVIWVFLFGCIIYHIIVSDKNGFVEAKRFSKFEDLEIENRIKAMNKPAVKIIKTIDGESYGCVDFYKQPAFDHPSMKNHRYTMRPIWKGIMRKQNTSDAEFGYLWENGVGCPVGTVPIQRVTKEDILRLDSYGDNHKPCGSWNTTSYDPNSPLHFDQHHFAVARTKNIGRRFHGATMELCITAPKVKPTQYSATRIHVQIGRDFIQAGLTVNPVLYKDHQPRTFVYTYAHGKSCYNSNCNTGVLVLRRDFPFGMALKPVSIRGANTSYYGSFRLVMDQKYENWWFQFGNNAVEIGLWPWYRFNQSFGNLVEWGGEVYSAFLPSPQMGYGYFPVEAVRYDAYIQNISVLDRDYNTDHNVMDLEDFSDNTQGYKVIDTRNPKHRGGHIIFYGGPGNI